MTASQHNGQSKNKEKAVDSRWACIVSGPYSSSGGNGQAEKNPAFYRQSEDGRSLLQQTIDNASFIVPMDQIVTVIEEKQREDFDHAVELDYAGRRLELPTGSGSALQIFAAAAYALNEDPEATLIIFPAELDMKPDDCFLKYVLNACHMAERFEDRLVLLGLESKSQLKDAPSGWIEPVPDNLNVSWNQREKIPRAVKHYEHTSDHPESPEHVGEDGYWNAMVLAVKAKKLWDIGNEIVPDIMRRLESLKTTFRSVEAGEVDPEHASIALSHVCKHSDRIDFSRDILQNAERWCGVIPMEDVTQSDSEELIKTRMDAEQLQEDFQTEKMGGAGEPTVQSA